MTETVVTEQGNTSIVPAPEPQTIVTQTTSIQTIVTGIMGPSGSSNAAVNTLPDVDVSQLSSGALLVYNTQTQKWTATKVLQEQTIECGQF